jgi:hypothetical protein
MFVFKGSHLIKASARFGLVVLFCASWFLSFSTEVSAQDDPVLRTDTSVVQLNVGVVDRQGRAITSLAQGDFAIYEDDVKRPIVAFEPTQSPFSLVMLLDMSGSTVNFRQREIKSVPGADRGPRAGSPRGVVDATGSGGFTPSRPLRVLTDPLETSNLIP